MALVLMATHGWGQLWDTSGNVQAGSQASFTDSTSAVAATHYVDATGASPSTGPITADANGRLLRWIEEGTYNMTLPGGSTLEVQAVSGATSAASEVLVRAGSGGALLTDDALIQTAVDAYAGERKVMLEGDFAVADGAASIEIPDFAHVEGRPGCTITKGGTAQIAVFTATGTIGSYVNLTANATRGSTTLTVPTTGIVADDWLMLRSDAPWRLSGVEASNRQGEQVNVRSITDSGHLEIYGVLNDTYTTADVARVAKITHRRSATLKGVKWICATPTTGNGGLLNSLWTKDLTVEDVAAQDYSGTALHLESGIGTKVSGAHGQNGCINGVTGTGYAYMVNLVGATQGATVSHITGYNGHNLITTDGSSRGGIARDCTISNSTVRGRWSVGGFHTHISAERVQYVGCGGSGQFVTGLFHISGTDCSIVGGNGGDIIGNGVYINTEAYGTVVQGLVIRNVYGAGNYGLVDAGSGTRVLGGFYENIVDGTSMIAAGGAGFYLQGTILKPGVTKSGLFIYDATDTSYAFDLTVIDANIGVAYSGPSPAPRIAGLKTLNVTTPINVVAALVSRETISATPTMTLAGALRFGTAVGTGTQYVEMFEQSADPAAPATDACRLWVKDNGAGKTQLMARFATGAIQQVAIQP